MADSEIQKAKKREQSLRVEACTFLESLIGRERMDRFQSAGFGKNILPNPHEGVISYIARELAVIGDEGSTLRRDAQENVSTKGMDVTITNRYIGQVEPSQMASVSVVTASNSSGVIGHALIVEGAGINSMSTADSQGKPVLKESEKFLSHLEAVNHAREIFPGATKMNAVVGGLVPFHFPHGGLPLDISQDIAA